MKGLRAKIIIEEMEIVGEREVEKVEEGVEEEVEDSFYISTILSIKNKCC